MSLFCQINVLDKIKNKSFIDALYRRKYIVDQRVIKVMMREIRGNYGNFIYIVVMLLEIMYVYRQGLYGNMGK